MPFVWSFGVSFIYTSRTSSSGSTQSGLTPGQSYYVQVDGTLAVTPSTPSVFAGTAVSTTKLIVKG